MKNFLFLRMVSKKPSKGKIRALGVAVFLLSFFIFFIRSKGEVPATSELAFIEHSSLGAHAGSVVPASCDSATPFASPTAAGGTAGSHFNGDCTTLCPDGIHSYDPYFDPGKAACFGCAVNYDGASSRVITSIVKSADGVVQPKILPGNSYRASDYGNYCFGNNSGTSYFAPLKTWAEFSRFWNQVNAGNIAGLYIIP